MPVKRALSYLALVLILAVLPNAAGCKTVDVTGSGEIATWDMDYSDFNRLEINSAFDVTINRADVYLVRITIDKALYAYLKIDQLGDTLYIGLKSNYNYINMTPQAVINLPDLRRLALNDASEAVVSGFTVSHSLDFALSGASRLDLGHTIAGNSNFSLSGASQVNGVIEMDDGTFNLSGASSLTLQGTADDISIDASGASHANMAELAVATASVKLSDASHAVINVSTRMDVDLSGASGLEYIGNPKLGKLEMSEGSELNQRQP
jgi:hypothetical protein